MEKKKQQTEKNVDPNSLAVPEILPILPLHGFVFYPGMGFPLQVTDESSKRLIDDALLGDRMIGLVSTKKSAPESIEHFKEDDCSEWELLAIFINSVKKKKNITM